MTSLIVFSFCRLLQHEMFQVLQLQQLVMLVNLSRQTKSLNTSEDHLIKNVFFFKSNIHLDESTSMT